MSISASINEAICSYMNTASARDREKSDRTPRRPAPSFQERERLMKRRSENEDR